MRTSAPLLACAIVALTIVNGQNPCAQAGVHCGAAEHHQLRLARRWRGMGPAVRHAWQRPGRCPTETNFANIEDLWPEEHFRGPHSGPKSYFVRVPPHFLGHHANFSRCHRRVYIDVGARMFDSKEGMLSTLKLYPQLANFDEYYAFEAVAGFYELPTQAKLQHKLRALGMSASRAETFTRRHFFFQAFIGARSDPSTSPPTIGFSDFLQTTLALQPADAVVVKMDVEGYEYDIVSSLLADGTHELIDEMMIEVHYGHPKMMRQFNWCREPKPGWQFWCGYTLQNATNMYESLRRAGVYAHHWP
jgi:hypothetical protein